MERITFALCVLLTATTAQIQTFADSQSQSDASEDLDEAYDWYTDYGMNSDLPFTRLTETTNSQETSFLQQFSPMSRDEDEYREDQQETRKGSGKTQWLLVTSFDADSRGSGKVWAVPTSNYTLGFTLIGGLTRPTGVCYDANHELLYVCDPGENAIYQYDISRKHFEFELRSDQVATIRSQGNAVDCSVGGNGDLYYLDGNATFVIDFSDLWMGYMDQQTLYAGDTDQFASPVAIAQSRNGTLFYLNSDNPGDMGLLKSVNNSQYRTLVREEKSATGLTVTSTGAYFSVTDGTVSST